MKRSFEVSIESEVSRSESVVSDGEDVRLHDRTSRRQNLIRLAQAGLVLGGASWGVRSLYEAPGFEANRPTGLRQIRDFRVPGTAGPEAPVMAIAKSSTDPTVLTQRAIEALGGMSRFISRGDHVALKPNIGWDRMPVHAANTNPLVVAEVVRLCLDAGAKQVVVTDASCNEARRSFQRSGIWKLAHEAGAKVVLPQAHRFRTMRLQGELLDLWPVYTPLIEADKVINVPVAKHHNLSLYTGAMKNWYGVLGGRRNRLHQNIHLSIADLATFMRPTLTVLDATRVLFRNGPQGGNIADARDLHQVIAGLDEVAIDTYGAGLLGVRAESVTYLRLGEERNLGQSSLSQVVEV
jgi:uncharacterized protein (DUF362 family)